MAAKWKRPANHVIQQWIDDVNSDGAEMTEWELNFMNSITDRDPSTLSEAQINCLERIYAKRT